MRKTRQFSLGLALNIFALLSACEGGVFVSARVVDSEGAPIAGARIRVSDPEGARVLEAEASAEGCVTAITIAAPGRYDFSVEVTATGFKPLSTKARSIEHHNFEVVLARDGQAFRSQVSAVATLPCPG